MNYLDASALFDYLHGVESIGEFIRAHDAEPIFAPAIALHEVFVGAARSGGKSGLTRVHEDVDWVEPVTLDVDSAAEAARVDAELHERGEPIGAIDTLVAGIVRDARGTLVTRDARFERVEGLDVIRYDDGVTTG